VNLVAVIIFVFLLSGMCVCLKTLLLAVHYRIISEKADKKDINVTGIDLFWKFIESLV